MRALIFDALSSPPGRACRRPSQRRGRAGVARHSAGRREYFPGALSLPQTRAQLGCARWLARRVGAARAIPLQAGATQPAPRTAKPEGSPTDGPIRRCAPWEGRAIPGGARLALGRLWGSEHVSVADSGHRGLTAAPMRPTPAERRATPALHSLGDVQAGPARAMERVWTEWMPGTFLALTAMAPGHPLSTKDSLSRLRGRVGEGVRRRPRPHTPAPLLRASSPPPFVPACSGSKSAPGVFVRTRERGECAIFTLTIENLPRWKI